MVVRRAVADPRGARRSSSRAAWPWRVLVLAALAASALVLALAAAPIGGGLAWTVLGAAAAVLVVGLAARLSR